MCWLRHAYMRYVLDLQLQLNPNKKVLYFLSLKMHQLGADWQHSR